MSDFKAMYIKLFKSQSKAISILQEAQQATEEMYIEAEDGQVVPLTVIKNDDPDEED